MRCQEHAILSNLCGDDASTVKRLTNIHRKVQALPVKEPEEDDVAILVSMRNCSNGSII